MIHMTRSNALKHAAVLSFLINAFGIVSTLPMIAQGAVALDASHGSPPFVVVLTSLLTGVVGVVAAYGTWKQQRWGIVLTILANAVNGLSAVPGILFAPGTSWLIVALATVMVSILIIVLCLWRDQRPVLA